MNEDIKLEYMHLCDYASPAINNKINIIGIFDNFIISKESMFFDFFIALRLSVKNKGKYTITFDIQSSKNADKIQFENKPIEIPENLNLLNFNILKQIKNLSFRESGYYKFIVLVNNLPVGYKELEVKLLEVKN